MCGLWSLLIHCNSYSIDRVERTLALPLLRKRRHWWKQRSIGVMEHSEWTSRRSVTEQSNARAFDLEKSKTKISITLDVVGTQWTWHNARRPRRVARVLNRGGKCCRVRRNHPWELLGSHRATTNLPRMIVHSRLLVLLTLLTLLTLQRLVHIARQPAALQRLILRINLHRLKRTTVRRTVLLRRLPATRRVHRLLLVDRHGVGVLCLSRPKSRRRKKGNWQRARKIVGIHHDAGQYSLVVRSLSNFVVFFSPGYSCRRYHRSA